MNKFSKRAALSYGWTEVKNNFSFILGLAGILLIYSIIFYFLTEIPGLVGVGFEIIRIIVGFIIGLGIIRISLNVYDETDFGYSELLNQKHLLLSVIGTTVIFTGLILPFAILGTFSIILFFSTSPLIAILLLIVSFVAALTIATILYFADYSIVDKQLGPIKAIKESIRITKGSRLNLFIFLLTLVVLNLLGLMLLGIGLFITLPLSFLAEAYVYCQLSKQAE